jgi:hypothetical protein
MQPTAFDHGHFHCLHSPHFRVNFNVFTKMCSHGFLKNENAKTVFRYNH